MSSLPLIRIHLEIKWLNHKFLHKKSFQNLQNKRKIITENSYSFKPFDDTKSIFIHIPKCAGISINKALYGNLAGGHTTLSEYAKIFEPKNFIEYFKFTIVRNPWDRVVSAYFFLKKGGFNEQDKDWFKMELSQFSSFDNFVKNWLNEDNIWKWHHFKPQYHYFIDNKSKINLDFIGFFEDINNDFILINNYIGSRAALKRLNKTKHHDYKDYKGYYSKTTKGIVARVYKKDIELLGYDFYNSNINN